MKETVSRKILKSLRKQILGIISMKNQGKTTLLEKTKSINPKLISRKLSILFGLCPCCQAIFDFVVPIAKVLDGGRQLILDTERVLHVSGDI